MIEVIACLEEELPDDLRRQTVEALRDEWPGAFTGEKANRTQLNDPALHAMIFSLLVDGQLASRLSVQRKIIEHRGESYKAHGLSGVLTVPAFRGKGYGERVVRAATAFMEQETARILASSPVTRLCERFTSAAAGRCWRERRSSVGHTPSHSQVTRWARSPLRISFPLALRSMRRISWAPRSGWICAKATSGSP